MLVIPLQSGSNGNCIYVECAGLRLLVDAGISGRQAERRLAEHGRDIRRVDALLLSHDHADHVRCAGIFHRRFGLQIHCSAATWAACSDRLGPVAPPTLFAPGEAIGFGGVRVDSVATPHDAVDGVAFVVDDGVARCGILTDLGHLFPGLGGILESCDAAIVESNYDPELLARGRYPLPLQERIRGDGGHLSNAEAAELVSGHGRHLRWLALGHLSEENNDPRLALAAQRHRVGSGGPEILLAQRGGSSGPWSL